MKKALHTYSKKTYSKKNAKTRHRQPNIINIYPTTIINVNVTKQYFYNTHSDVTSSGDEFDKLVKAPTYQAPGQSVLISPTIEKRKFCERQQSRYFYNSDIGSSDISSVNLFKDPGDSSFSPSGLPSPPKQHVVKKRRNQNRVYKRKVKKTKINLGYQRYDSVSMEGSCTMRTIKSAASSTPTNPNLLFPESGLSPIMTSDLPFKIKLNSSVHDMFAIKDSEDDEEREEVKQKSLGMTALLEGMGNLGIKTPNPKARALENNCSHSQEIPENELIQNDKLVDESEIFEKSSVDNYSDPQELSEGESHVDKNPINKLETPEKSPFELFNEGNDCQIKINLNKDDEDNEVIEKVTYRRRTKLSIHSTPTSRFCEEKNEKEGSRESCEKNKQLLDLTSEHFNLSSNISQCETVERSSPSPRAEKVTFCCNGGNKKNEFSFIENCTNIQTRKSEIMGKRSSVFSRAEDKIICCASENKENEFSHLENCKKNESSFFTVEHLKGKVTPKLDNVSEKESRPSEEKVLVQNTSDESIRIESNKLSLQPGKKWRRSLLQSKQESKGYRGYSLCQPKSRRSTVGPSLLAKLVASNVILNSIKPSLNSTSNQVKDSDDLGSSRADMSYIISNNSILNDTARMLNRLSSRNYKYKREMPSLFCNSTINESLEESSASDEDRIALVTSSTEDLPLTVYGETNVDESSQSASPEDCSVSDSFNQHSYCKNKSPCTNFETPPIMKVVGNTLNSITKRKRTRTRLRSSFMDLNCLKEETNNFTVDLNDEGDISISSNKSDDIFQEFSLQTDEESSNMCLARNEEDNVSQSSKESEDSFNEHVPLGDDEKGIFNLTKIIEHMDDEEFKHMGRAGVMMRCNQTSPLKFNEAFPDELLIKSEKLGEGVFGEVFLLQRPEGKTVLKIVPVEGSQQVNAEDQKSFIDILAELIIAEELSNLRKRPHLRTSGFVEIKNKFCIQGRYPPILLDLWHAYDKKKRSENDCPDMFGPEQLYVAVELEHCGIPVDEYRFTSAKETYSIYLQNVFTLATAELDLQFEHRDLHVGNVLVQATSDNYIDFSHNGVKFKVPSYGVKATIIDFTLSRMSYKKEVLYLDLEKDPDLFTASGDYQFEIYRLMRSDLNKDWREHAPKTNIRWLHYLADKLIKNCRFSNPKTKMHKTFMQRLEQHKQMIPDFSSSSDLAEFLLKAHLQTMNIIRSESDNPSGFKF